uniref:Uncharacterized protein n=1 Tax=Gasterosteus aculeatus aculeatus TaxID=481459 RepID=A0AAQ4PMU8_GASAC|nr:uncharacterized protein C7orf57 homolog [Gasterosteus aculeatus aculeatus]XP_040026378.1 uncharacterized protein C7orf57 homolog [Gasterosteus aculeatus aculeatus]
MSSAEMSAAVPNHRRTKPGGIKTVPVSSSGATGPNSQIPGLSQTADETSPVERTSGRRVGIFASDSEYVKLAKGGGHKGLLSHDDDEADDLPVTAYNPPNWFGDESKGGNKTASPGGVRMASRQPMAAPFGTDNSSSWESGDIISPDKEKMSPDGVADEMEGLSMTNKYKRTCYEKKAPPVSMTRLLSHGYMADKKKSAENDDDDASSVTSEQTSTTVTEDAGELE